MVVLVTGARLPIGAAALAALGERGVPVDATAEAVEAVCHRHGPVDGLIHAHIDERAADGTPIVGLDAAAWRARSEPSILATAAVCTAARAHFVESKRRGRIVVVVPTVSQLGAAGLVALVTSLEAQRTLVKSLARAWGLEGITVNCVAPTLDVALGRDFPSNPGQALHQPALEDAGDAAAVGRLVVMFLDSIAGRVTGQTLQADGGMWMP